jgi:hypothetical protein
MRHMTETNFKRFYRLCKDDFIALISLLEPDFRRVQSRPHGVDSSLLPLAMTAVTLRYLSGAKILDVGWPYGLQDATVYAVIDEVLEYIHERLGNIQFPSSEEDFQREDAAFQRLRRSTMHILVAALDGIAIAIRCPKRFRIG